MPLFELKNFHEKYLNFLLKLRNKNYVIKNSISQKKINSIEHKEWFLKIKKNSKIKIYLLFLKKKPIGMIRVSTKQSYYELSWAILKKYSGKNILASKLKILIKNKKKYLAKILVHNTRSQILALKIGLLFYKRHKNILIYKKN